MARDWCANPVRLFALTYGVLLLGALVARHRRERRFLRSRTATGREPTRLFGVWAMPRLDPLAAEGVFWVLAGALALLIVGGALARPAAAVAGAAALLWFAQIRDAAHVRRKANTIPVVLFTLACAAGVDRPLDERSDTWPLVLVSVVVVQIYFSAGVQKLRRCGWRWADGRVLAAVLVSQDLSDDNVLATRLASRPGLCRAAATSVLLFELTSPLMLLAPSLTLVYVAGGLCFHLAGAVMLRIRYLPYLGPAYLAVVLGGGALWR